MFGCSSIGTMSIKYIIPGYSKTLITISNDKDFRSMIKIHGDSVTIELYVMNDEMLPLDVSNMQQCTRSEAVNDANATLELIAPVSDFGDTNYVESHVENSPTMSRGYCLSPFSDENINHSYLRIMFNYLITDEEEHCPTPQSDRMITDEEEHCPTPQSDLMITYEEEHRQTPLFDGLDNMTDGMLSLDVSNMQQCIRRTRLPEAMAPADASINIVNNAVDDTNATLELIAPAIALVSGFGDTNYVESHIDIPIEVSLMMPRGDPNDAKLWKNAITGVGQTFNSVDELRESIRKYAIAHQFAFRFKKNDSDRVIVKCKTEGCPWEIHALRSPESAELFRIQKMASEHDCDKAAATTGHQATSSLVAGFIEEKLKVSPNYCYKIKDIVSDFKQEHGIQITYQQARRAKMKVNGIEITNQPARRAKNKAEKGQRKEHRQLPPLGEMITVEVEHRQTPLLCEMIIEENPGGLATFTTKDDSTFPGRFFAFRASLLGFEQGCRPLLFLDSILLPSKFLLLTAFTVDGDGNDLPIAFAVVDRENEKNWHWFLLQLKACLSITCPITFVADRRYGLKESISNVFPGSFYTFCIEYLIADLFEELKEPISSYVKSQIQIYCNDAWFASSPKGFHKSLERIKEISSEAYNWISKTEPTNWSKAFFPGERYAYMRAYSNVFEYEMCEACEEVSSVTQLVHALEVWTLELIIERRTASAQWMSRLIPSKEKMLENEKKEAGCLEVLGSAGSTYEVVGGVFSNKEVVDIDKRNCGCKMWQFTGIPCSHALAVIYSIDGCPYEYCSRYCTTENYRLTYSFN